MTYARIWWVVLLAGCSGNVDTGDDAGSGGIDAGPRDAGVSGIDAGGSDAGGTDAGPVTGACDAPLLRCGTACVDVSTSADHCGACDAACAGTCVSGVCDGTASCPPGTVDCGGECRDVSGDPEFCGSCAGGQVRCAADELCSDGACVCRPGLTDCGGTCVDTDSDPANCGGCGTPCADVCAGGMCGDASACTLEVCGSACVDTDTDLGNCGTCGNACAHDQICIDGECWDYEPAAGCTTCGACDFCPGDEPCCDLPGYGLSCIGTCPGG